MSGLISTLQGYGQYSWQAPAWFGPLVILAVIWTFIWKGMALWKAGRNASKGWFVVLLLVNTVGILDLLYVLVFSKKTQSNQPNI
jgi:hypothetical protein